MRTLVSTRAFVATIQLADSSLLHSRFISTGGKFTDAGQTKCEDCPDGATCRDGQIYINNEFWMAPNVTLNNETRLYECVHPGACIGNPDVAANFSCREGHEDRLCGTLNVLHDFTHKLCSCS